MVIIPTDGTATQAVVLAVADLVEEDLAEADLVAEVVSVAVAEVEAAPAEDFKIRSRF